MLTIGLTGGIGTGKSAVARLLQELGAELIEADKVGHEAYRPHTEAWNEVVATFGQQVLQPDEEVDRRKLGAIVFSDPASLAKLNAIMHPKMARMIGERLCQMAGRGVKVAVVEAAILLEAGWTHLVDEVWVVTTPLDQVARRLHARNGLSEEEVRARVGAQMPQEERVRHAHAVVDNGGTLEQLRETLSALWRERVVARVAADG